MIIDLSTFGPLSDATWVLATTMICFQVSLCLSIITACISSLKVVGDIFLGGDGRECHELTRLGVCNASRSVEYHQGRYYKTHPTLNRNFGDEERTIALSTTRTGGESVERLNPGS
jgi:hypothetical protein